MIDADFIKRHCMACLLSNYVCIILAAENQESRSQSNSILLQESAYPCPGERVKGTLGARLLCLVSSPHFARKLCLSGYVVRARFLCKSFHHNALTEKAWEDTVEGKRKGLLRTLRSCEYRVRFNLLALN